MSDDRRGPPDNSADRGRLEEVGRQMNVTPPGHQDQKTRTSPKLRWPAAAHAIPASGETKSSADRRPLHRYMGWSTGRELERIIDQPEAESLVVSDVCSVRCLEVYGCAIGAGHAKSVPHQ